MASPDIAASQIAPQERFLKLYRTLHNLYLKTDFVNAKDFNQAISEINARITQLEAKITAELAKVQIGLATHIHAVPQAPSGTLPSFAPASPPYTSGFSATKPVVTQVAFAEQRDGILQATGPAIAPIGA